MRSQNLLISAADDLTANWLWLCRTDMTETVQEFVKYILACVGLSTRKLALAWLCRTDMTKTVQEFVKYILACVGLNQQFVK